MKFAFEEFIDWKKLFQIKDQTIKNMALVIFFLYSSIYMFLHFNLEIIFNKTQIIHFKWRSIAEEKKKKNICIE